MIEVPAHVLVVRRVHRGFSNESLVREELLISDESRCL